MDPDTYLPRSLRFDGLNEHVLASPRVSAHIMPFSIEYTGTAPVNTYFIARPVISILADGVASSQKHDSIDFAKDKEAISAFRGRKLHGTRLELPPSYRLDFFRTRKEDISSNTGKQMVMKNRPLLVPKPANAPPKPVRGLRFSLNDDEEDMPGMPVTSSDTNNDISSTLAVEEIEPENTTKSIPDHFVCPIFSVGNSLWIWSPDGPVDAGDDVYFRSMNEWVKTIVPVVSVSTLYSLTYSYTVSTESLKSKIKITLQQTIYESILT